MTRKALDTFNADRSRLAEAGLTRADDLGAAQHRIDELAAMLAAVCPHGLVSKACTVLYGDNELQAFLQSHRARPDRGALTPRPGLLAGT